ncbi:hypothetical protein PAMP_001989 [Pampus punctatissimus]
MAAAESDRDPPSALCSEFLNFSAKDTASRWMASADLQQEFVDQDVMMSCISQRTP